MNSAGDKEMSEEEFSQCVDSERAGVVRYLTAHGINNPSVGPWPAFEVAPYFAIWAVESKITPGKIGWWAFSGDCPTDYVSEDGKCHPRNALRILLENWRNYIPYMKKGANPPNTKFPEGADLPMLAELLEKRVITLEEWHADDELWEDR